MCIFKILFAAFLLGLLPIGSYAASSDFARSVKDFGAKGDGVTDDTDAFQKALAEAGEAGGGIVRVPAGNYMIKTHLSIPACVTLEGIWTAPPCPTKIEPPSIVSAKNNSDKTWLTGSVLLAVEGAGDSNGVPFITLNTNSTLKGMTIYYPEQKVDTEPVAYPWCVASAGCDNPSIIDCLLVNPYQGVDFGSRVAGRHYIRNLYGQPLYKGLFVDVCFDVGRLENIHFWPFWTAHVLGGKAPKTDDWVFKNGTAFIFARSDWEYVSNCFAILYKTGIHFMKASDPGPGNYLMTQSGADCCDVAVFVEETQGHSGISFSNSQIFGRIVVSEKNSGPVRFTSCGIFGASGEIEAQEMIRIDGRGRVSFDNCSFHAIDPAPKTKEYINVAGGRIGISNSVFIGTAGHAPIVIGEKTVSAIITGNEFYSNRQIVNNAKKNVVIKDNLFGTDEN
ncbi:MAG: glycosyl hydrolase family 28-related protein [Armatimonadota bacterium]